MMVADRNAVDVTPRHIQLREVHRAKDSARHNADKLKRQVAIAETEEKLAEIEAKITKMRKEKWPEKKITPHRQAWDFHTDKLKKLKGR
jgi:hypothetical protein